MKTQFEINSSINTYVLYGSSFTCNFEIKPLFFKRNPK